MRRIGEDVLKWLTITFVLCAATVAQANPRIALVIGNSSYESVSSLDNPVPDAQLISRQLQDTGFEVTLLTDATLSELRSAISTFGKSLRAAGPEATGLFYYAGHGVQSFGSNYLLPVDAELSDAADLDLVSLEAASVLRQMASAKNKTNIVILDACRDNPFESIADLNESGLAEMKAPTGTFLAYATSPGAVAYDGAGENSPFTSALSRQLPVADQPIEETFRNVRISVIEETGGAQTPWDTSSLTNAFFFSESEPLAEEDRAAKSLWDQVKLTRDPIQILLFLRAYPGSIFEDEARDMLASVVGEELEPNNQPVADASPLPQVGAETQQQAEVTPPVAAAPAPIAPSATEREMIEIARLSGALADYEAYLDAFPDGRFAELAEFEVNILKEKALAAAAPEPEPEPEHPQQPDPQWADPVARAYDHAGSPGQANASAGGGVAGSLLERADLQQLPSMDT